MLQNFINQFKRCQAEGKAISVRLEDTKMYPAPGKDDKAILVRGYYHCVVYNQKCSFGNCPINTESRWSLDELMKTIGIKP